MWVTVFVIDQKEQLSDKSFPAFQTSGKLFLYMKDAISNDRVAVGFMVTAVFYDLHAQTPRQYVHLTKLASA